MPELIDREVTQLFLNTAIKQFGENCLQDKLTQNGLLIAKQIVSKQPAIVAEPVNRWIPCSERLPDDRKCVLVTDGENIEITYFDGSDWEMYDQYGNHYELYVKVTHWMPLPEAPYPPEKEVSEDETL